MFLICNFSLLFSVFLCFVVVPPCFVLRVHQQYKETLKQIDRFCVMNAAASISNVFLGQMIIASSEQNKILFSCCLLFFRVHTTGKNLVSQPFLKGKKVFFSTFKSSLSSLLTDKSITSVSLLCP